MEGEKYIPVEKMQKKKQKELAKKQRGSWMGVKPVTKIVSSNKKEKIEKARIKDNSLE